MKEFLEYLIKNIVDFPDEAKVELGEDEKGQVAYIYLNEEDRPLLIGKQGNNIKAIRELCSVVSRKTGEKVYIKIQD